MSNKDDCISRQMAIDAMKDALNPHIVQFVKSKMAIEALPSAQPDHVADVSKKVGWIPCSERLPEKMGYYLISNEYKVVHEDYYWGSGCFEKAKKYQCEVEAWMPMPIPPYYGGNGE
mgnify:CR=1 FL=1